MKRQIKIDKKRKLEKKTNYTKRLLLLKGDHPRLVVRKTNKYIIIQIIESKHAQDKILYSITTRDLLKQGWPENKKGSLKSLAAGYLAGLLLGNKAKDKIQEKIILDTGLIPSTKGSRIYAVVKGVSDSGIKIDFDEKIIPSEERIKADYEFFDEIKNKIGTTKPITSQNKSDKEESSNNKKQEDNKINTNGDIK
jgi:large subunit ribosomal protein L18